MRSNYSGWKRHFRWQKFTLLSEKSQNISPMHWSLSLPSFNTSCKSSLKFHQRLANGEILISCSGHVLSHFGLGQDNLFSFYISYREEKEFHLIVESFCRNSFKLPNSPCCTIYAYKCIPCTLLFFYKNLFFIRTSRLKLTHILTTY